MNGGAGRASGCVTSHLQFQNSSAFVGVYLRQLIEWYAPEPPYPLAHRLDQLITPLWSEAAAAWADGLEPMHP
jgi:hypothetical protein